MPWTLRPFRPGEADSFRALRLEALRLEPAAFGSSPADEPDAAGALLAGTVYGGFDASGEPCGMAGLALNAAQKTRHKARLWGVYVRPAARGGGLGRALVAYVAAEARGRADWLLADVVAANPAALRLYESLGFVRYGVEPAALRVDGRDHDLCLLQLRL